MIINCPHCHAINSGPQPPRPAPAQTASGTTMHKPVPLAVTCNHCSGQYTVTVNSTRKGTR